MAFVLFLGVSFSGIAQNQQSSLVGNGVFPSSIARIDQNKRLYIRGSSVEQLYKISINHLGLNDLEEVQNYFDALDLAHVHFTAESKDYVLMHLHTDDAATTNWSLIEWDEHFSQVKN